MGNQVEEPALGVGCADGILVGKIDGSPEGFNVGTVVGCSMVLRSVLWSAFDLGLQSVATMAELMVLSLVLVKGLHLVLCWEQRKEILLDLLMVGRTENEKV